MVLIAACATVVCGCTPERSPTPAASQPAAALSVPPAPSTSAPLSRRPEDSGASAASASPRIHEAMIAYELAAVMRAKTPADHAKLPSTTFVPLGRPAELPAAQKLVTFIVAREATFEVVDIERNEPPMALTTFGTGSAACVGRGERKVALRWPSGETGRPPVEEGVILEGCPPPQNAYAVVVVEGAHPDALLVDTGTGRTVRLGSGAEIPVPAP